MERDGLYIEPTIFTDVKPNMKINKEEIFGPVAVVIKFTTEEEVIEMANDSLYGLSSVVWTQDLTRAIRVSHALEAGSTWVRRSLISSFIVLQIVHYTHSQINQAAVPDFLVSFGGIKQSGFGKDMGEYALEKCVFLLSLIAAVIYASLRSYTNVKSVHINLGLTL